MEGSEACNLHRKWCQTPSSSPPSSVSHLPGEQRGHERTCKGETEGAWVPESPMGAETPWEPVTRSIHTETIQDPGQSTHCAQPPASWAVCYTVVRIYLTACTPGPRMKKHSRHSFSRLQTPCLPAYIFQSTLCSHAAGVFSNK